MIYQKRLTAIYVIILCLFTFTIFRLYIISTSTAASEALSGQYSRKLTIAERRGFIYDRNGMLLNAEEDGYICLVLPKSVNTPKTLAENLSKLSGKLESEIVEKLKRGEPFTVKLSEKYDEQGVYCYPAYNERTICAPHIVGYTNSEKNGVTGVESGFNSLLSKFYNGVVTYRYHADTQGVPLSESGSTLTDNGYSESSGVMLTIDRNLQLFCEETARKNISMGALCVSDITTGEILASVSLPDFEVSNIAAYLDSDKGELINRCVRSFTPGSIFKTVVAAAALERDISLYDLEYTCTGNYELSDGRAFSCHKKSGHGTLTMVEAYAESCNTYFINLASKIGIDAVLELSEKMGIGTEKNLYGICDYGGLLPTTSDDTEGFTANTAIGQGKLLICPYEALNIYSCAATGYYCTPHVTSRIFCGKETVQQFESKKITVLSKKTVEKLCEMMGECTENGLGKSANPAGGNAGGKTATAQTGQYKNGKEILNSWFCGVYPLSEPKYAICVLSDGNGEEGNPKAVFKEICEYLSETYDILVE